MGSAVGVEAHYGVVGCDDGGASSSSSDGDDDLADELADAMCKAEEKRISTPPDEGVRGGRVASRGKRKLAEVGEGGGDGGGDGQGDGEGAPGASGRAPTAARASEATAVPDGQPGGSPGLASLPHEMLASVLRWLSPEDLTNAGQTCHALRAPTFDDSLWRRCYCARFGHTKLLQKRGSFGCGVAGVAGPDSGGGGRKAVARYWRALYFHDDARELRQAVGGAPPALRPIYAQMQAGRRGGAAACHCLPSPLHAGPLRPLRPLILQPALKFTSQLHSVPRRCSRQAEKGKRREALTAGGEAVAAPRRRHPAQRRRAPHADGRGERHPLARQSRQGLPDHACRVILHNLGRRLLS